MCHKRVDFMFQCAHELVADKKFMLSKYSDRWLNTYCYYRIYPENLPTKRSIDTENSYEEIEIPSVVNNEVVNHYANDVECSQDTIMVDHNNMAVGNLSRITYHDMVKKLTELARTVQFKQEDCITVMADISKMIDQYRSKRPFVMTLNTFDESDKVNDLVISESAKLDAIPASTSTRSSLVTKRKMSLLEYQRTNRNKKKESPERLQSVMLLIRLHQQERLTMLSVNPKMDLVM